MSIYSISNIGQVIAGPGSINQIRDIVAANQIKTALLVSDAGLSHCGLVDKLREILEASAVVVTILDNTPPEPEVAHVKAMLAEAEGKDYDLIIGLGGGSAMDVAKLLSVLLGGLHSIDELLKGSPVTARKLRTLMIPTTAGTGSEATPNSIVLVPEQSIKIGIVSTKLVPEYVILDPELTLSLPPAITAATGMDALAHAMECFTSKKGNPFSELYALKAISLIFRSIRRAYQHGSDLEARQDMLLASFYGGLCIATSSTTAVHALAYPLGGKYRIAHGISNAILLPYVMQFNSVGNEETFIRMVDAMSIERTGLTTKEAVQKMVKALFTLNKDLGIPGDLKQWHITQNDLEALVEGAAKVTRLLDNNPRSMNREQIRAIYQQLL